jgi:ABC-2 type transport system permease protein
MMIRKIFAIFMRDLRVSFRDFIALYIILMPLMFSLVINIFTPGINDSTINLALIDQQDPAQVSYYETFAKVEVFPTQEALEARVMKRDNIIGILNDGDGFYLLAQGNEPESVVEFAKVLKTFYEQGATVADTQATIVDFGRTIPPLKKVFVNGAIMFISVLGGMLIALNIVEEKVDNTLSAVNVSPISRLGYILGKSAIGVIVPIVGTLLMLLLTGFGNVNFLLILVMVLTSSMISILIGFIEGITNEDIMSAAGNMKILFLPLMGSIAAVEMLEEKWQPFFYWIPFYWSYKGNDLVLSKSDNWSQVLMYASFVVLISALVFVLLAPRIRKGLE